MKEKFYTKALVGTGLLIGIATILRSFGIMVPIAGAAAMRISFDSIFYKLPGLLFGPIYGGIAGGITDLLAYMLRPMGAFIPFMTLTTIIGGALPGVIWKAIKDVPVEKLKRYYIVFFNFLGAVGILNLAILSLLPNSFIAKSIMAMGKKAQYTSTGLIMISLIGIIYYIINNKIKDRESGKIIHDNFLKVVVSIGLPGILVSTMNTYILLLFIPSLKGKAFMLLWAPRIVETLLMILIESYIMSILLFSYNSFGKKVFSVK